MPHLSFLCSQWVAKTHTGKPGKEFSLMTNEVIDTIYKRRSVRRYNNKEVELEKLDLLLKAAMAAPTACNNQSWEFIVVTDKTLLNKLQQNLEYGPYEAPAAIIPCHNPNLVRNPRCEPFWEQDLSAAIENMLIAAVSLGLGTVWLGVYPKEDILAFVRKAFKIPEEVVPIAIILTGYPAENKHPRTQFKEERVHWEYYQIPEKNETD
jgi:nitroreductase